MALVEIKCQNCGGDLKVESNAQSYYCPHCRSAFVMEQTVNQTFQTTNIGHIDTANFFDDGSGKIDQEIKGGEALLQLRKYEEAKSVFDDLTSRYAHKYQAWWGLARAITHNFTKEITGETEYLDMEDALDSAFQLAPVDERAQIQDVNATYRSKWEAYHDQLIQERFQRINEIEDREKALIEPQQKRIEEFNATIAKKTAIVEKLEKLKKVVPLIAAGAIGSLLLLLVLLSGENGVVSAVIVTVLLAGVLIYLPLRLIFFFVCKTVQVSADLAIKNLDNQISKIQNELQTHKSQFYSEKNEVYMQTRWLDN